MCGVAGWGITLHTRLFHEFGLRPHAYRVPFFHEVWRVLILLSWACDRPRLLNAHQERQPCLGAYNSNISAVELSLLSYYIHRSRHIPKFMTQTSQNKSSQESQSEAHIV